MHRFQASKDRPDPVVRDIPRQFCEAVDTLPMYTDVICLQVSNYTSSNDYFSISIETLSNQVHKLLKSQISIQTNPSQLRLPQHPILLRHKRRNHIHQARTQRIISAQPQSLQLPSDLIRLLRSHQPLLNHRTHKRRKLDFLPPFLVAQLDMHKVQAVEGMLGFNASVHVHTTVLARVALDHGVLVDNAEFGFAGGDGERRARDDAYDAEDCTGRFPALGAAAGVVVRDV